MGTLPRVGITCDFETITDSRGKPALRFVSPAAYAQAVARAGGTALILPHAPEQNVEAIIAALDALVVTGGDFDIPPEQYGHSNTGSRLLMPERTQFEADLARAAMARDIPLLGVCGGMQLLNVLLGGSLYQDLSERDGTGVHEQPEDKSKPFHDVVLTDDSAWAQLCATKVLQVNSTHHQVIRDLGEGVLATGLAPDGVIEAIEVPAYRFAFGAQWHPELLDAPEQHRIYQGLVAAARKT